VTHGQDHGKDDDNTTEITIEARQPMRETLMLDAFHA